MLTVQIGNIVKENPTIKTSKDDTVTVKKEKIAYQPAIVNLMPLKLPTSKRAVSGAQLAGIFEF